MKIHITVPDRTAHWFWNMNNLLSKSLQDCGHSIESYENAELIIALQHFPAHVNKVAGKKYILLQTEQKHYPGIHIPAYYRFADKIWGFEINNPPEEYICLGYHPCLELKCPVAYSLNIGFIGCPTPRRSEFQAKIRNKFTGIGTWDYVKKLQNIKRTRINLNIHAWADTIYTEWDRICLMLANKAFLLSDQMYCPLPIIQFTNAEDYDQKVDNYLSHEKEREDISEKLYLEYKSKFDMRKILTEKLKRI